MLPNLKITGTVLGRREQPANRTTGEASRYSFLDLYTADGPVALQVPADLPTPEAGVAVECTLSLRAYNGFLSTDKDGKIKSQGDPRISATATRVDWVQPEAVPAPRGKTKAAA